jgi:hypothetical protein
VAFSIGVFLSARVDLPFRFFHVQRTIHVVVVRVLLENVSVTFAKAFIFLLLFVACLVFIPPFSAQIRGDLGEQIGRMMIQ